MGQRHHKKRRKVDEKLLEKLVSLRHFVDNINRTPDLALRGGVYKKLSKTDIFTTTIDGFEYGYKLEDHNLFMRRKIFIKCEQPLSEVPDKDKDVAMAAALNIFCDKGQNIPKVEQIALDAILLQQDFMPLVLTRANN